MMNMNIGRITLTVLVATGLLLVGGCGVRDDVVPRAFAQRMDTIRESLMRGGGGFAHHKEFEATDRLFDGIPDGAARQAAALAFGDMLLSVDLSSLSYRMRESTTSLYALYVCQCFRNMERCGVSTRTAVEFFFRGLAAYRDSCLTVSSDEAVADESPVETRARRECARILRQDYELRMRIFAQIWLPDLSRYLPPEYHDEFRRRLKAFEIPEARPMARQAVQVSEVGDAR